MALPTAAQPRIAPPSPRAAGLIPTGKPVAFGAIAQNEGDRIGIYGVGGIGKSSLAVTAPGPVGVIDAERSLQKLARGKRLPSDIQIVAGVDSYQSLREALCGPGWDGCASIDLDSITLVQEWAEAHVLATVPHEKGHPITRLEDYGFGKGYRHVYDAMVAVFGDLEAHIRQGRNVVVVAHETCSKVPNPEGDEYLRYEPLLQASDKSNVREKFRNWCDHLIYIGYDVSVADAKAKGSGSRTLHVAARPCWVAKSRSIKRDVEYREGDASLWQAMFTPIPQEGQQ